MRLNIVHDFEKRYNFKSWRIFFGSGISKFPIAPLLFGMSVGWLRAVFIENSLFLKNVELRLNMANIATAQNNAESGNGLAGFLANAINSIHDSKNGSHDVAIMEIMRGNDKIVLTYGGDEPDSL